MRINCFYCLQPDLSKIVFDFDDDHTANVYSMISPIRALLLRKKDPERWNLVWSHMSHQDERRKSQFWREKNASMIGYIKVSN